MIALLWLGCAGQKACHTRVNEYCANQLNEWAPGEEVDLEITTCQEHCRVTPGCTGGYEHRKKCFFFGVEQNGVDAYCEVGAGELPGSSAFHCISGQSDSCLITIYCPNSMYRLILFVRFTIHCTDPCFNANQAALHVHGPATASARIGSLVWWSWARRSTAARHRAAPILPAPQDATIRTTTLASTSGWTRRSTHSAIRPRT